MAKTNPAAPVRIMEETPAYWRVVFEYPPFNILDATIFEGLQDLLVRVDTSQRLRVIVLPNIQRTTFRCMPNVLSQAPWSISKNSIKPLSPAIICIRWTKVSSVAQSRMLSLSSPCVAFPSAVLKADITSSKERAVS